ncbi:MAG: aminomethyl-transferring glycine dehydrogenase subunit GcvPA [Gammaproteobacteria bacterium]|nr:aminomethyl-transferring glycine dehydrogenase subunit GcvPA [Gammaproteobacteria bacterium]
MPYIPHTEEEISSMLSAIGIKQLDQLFDEIPKKLRIKTIDAIPEAVSEMALRRTMQVRANQDGSPLCFIGAGAYEHHIPSAVWQIASRGEFYSAYTPYQAEASQGTLQLIYEYQTMMAGLMAMDISNASLYDGASALAEAVLMAIRANRKCKTRRVLVAGTVNPVYRACINAIVKNQQIELIELPYCTEAGNSLAGSLKQHESQEFAALVIQQPNFFGCLENVDELTDWAHQQNALMIAAVNPLLMAALKPPGEWGQNGADIACGDGQPLGAPLSCGGPYYGFMCCKNEIVRQMPGRIVGRTQDINGHEGFVLTLQAREQHIRRSKATSNICTNQGLVVTASAIYMAIMGPEGLRRIAAQCYANRNALIQAVGSLKGVEVVFTSPGFHECVLRLNKPVEDVMAVFYAQGILPGYNLKKDYPELGEALLVCVTETKTDDDIELYKNTLQQALA